jgi:hypothetical protein
LCDGDEDPVGACMYIERVRGDFWATAVVTMCCSKEVVKIS